MVLLKNSKVLRLQVKATAGDTHLGGEDFDNRLVAHFVEVSQARLFNYSVPPPLPLLLPPTHFPTNHPPFSS